MVFNSIPQFPWSSSRTPHPTERNNFCIFTPNCPIWKKKYLQRLQSQSTHQSTHITNTSKSTSSSMNRYKTHRKKRISQDTSLQHYPCWRQATAYSWATSLCAEESLIATRCKRPEFKSCKTKPAQTPFLASLGCVTSKPFLKNVGMVYDDTANKCSPPKKIREIFHYIM